MVQLLSQLIPGCELYLVCRGQIPPTSGLCWHPPKASAYVFVHFLLKVSCQDQFSSLKQEMVTLLPIAAKACGCKQWGSGNTHPSLPASGHKAREACRRDECRFRGLHALRGRPGLRTMDARMPMPFTLDLNHSQHHKPELSR